MLLSIEKEFISNKNLNFNLSLVFTFNGHVLIKLQG
jgi:hypothetical protein